MKKVFTIILSLGVLFSTFLPAYAAPAVIDADANILAIEETYFAEHNVQSREELTSDQINELSLLIQTEKSRIFGDETGISTCAYLSDYTGGIFLQFDSSSNMGSLGWDHGHAAIGYADGTVEILGPSYTVTQYYHNRIEQWYDCNTGGFYTVRSATGANNLAAASNAHGKIGSRYYVVGTLDFSGYTCSGLVATSWTEAGFNLGGKWTTPAGLENNSLTILQWLWTDV